MIWKIWKKGKLNSGKIRKIWKKGKSNSAEIWEIQKKIVKRYDKDGRKVSWIVKRYEKYGKKTKLNSEMIWKIWKISVLVKITPKETSSCSSLSPPL